MKIYFDTNVWNQSLSQSLQPQLVMQPLVAAGLVPVLGIHVVYELQKTFHSAADGARDKGRALFSHLSEYFAAGLVYVAKEVTELLVAEMYSLKGAAGGGKFLEVDDLAKLFLAVERFACGDVAPKWLIHTFEKASEIDRARSTLRAQVDQSGPVEKTLKTIPEAQLEQWLTREARSEQSLLRLADHIMRLFPDAPRHEAIDWAVGLISHSGNSLSLGLLKADLYCNWRCANRGSIPTDLLDDIYHVLNACYCDVYVTAEPKQANYASLLLPRATRVEIYRREEMPLDEWLQSL